MTTTDQTLETPRVQLARIHDHEANPRINAVADPEFVESIRRQGVLDPLMVAPRADGDYDLIDGHRRKDGAAQAGLLEVPVNVRYDLVTEAQKIEVMVVTGLQKELLTPVEEAAGYEQLSLLGFDEEAIAAATGFGVRRVRERLKLNTLPPEVRTGVHTGDISLVDIAALDEFAGDAVAVTELEERLGTPNFRQHVFEMRSRREREARKATVIARFVEAGALAVRSVPGAPGRVVDVETGEEFQVSGMHMFPADLKDPAAHDGCLGYLDPDYLYSDPYLVCLDPAKHPQPAAVAPTAPVDSEWEKKQAERQADAARLAAASAARLEWLREHFTGMFPTKSHQPLAKAAQAFLPVLITDPRDSINAGVLLDAFGIHLEAQNYQAQDDAKASYATGIGALNPTGVLASFAAYLAAAVTDLLDVPALDLDTPTELLHQLTLWDWLKAAGYPMSDVDTQIRRELEVKHTEVSADAEAS